MLIEPFIEASDIFQRFDALAMDKVVVRRSFEDLANSGKIRDWLVSDWPISRLDLEKLRNCDANPQLLYVLRLDQ